MKAYTKKELQYLIKDASDRLGCSEVKSEGFRIALRELQYLKKLYHESFVPKNTTGATTY